MMRTERNGLAIMARADRRKERQDQTPEARLERARDRARVAYEQTLGRVELAISTCWDLGTPIPYEAQEEMQRRARARYEERVAAISEATGFALWQLVD